MHSKSRSSCSTDGGIGVVVDERGADRRSRSGRGGRRTARRTPAPIVIDYRRARSPADAPTNSRRSAPCAPARGCSRLRDRRAPRRTAHVCGSRSARQPLRDDATARSSVPSARFAEVTTKRDALVALQDSEERFRMLAENAADVVYRFSIGAIAELRVREPGGRVGARVPAAGVLRRSRSLIVRVTHDDDIDAGASSSARWRGETWSRCSCA